MHWKAWGLMREFAHKFGGPPLAPDGLPPAQLARLMQKSLLSGEVASPLTMPPPRDRINVATPRSERVGHPPRSAKMRAYLDNLDKRGCR